MSASIGVTLVADPTAAPDALLREADAAMYRAKEAGRSRYALFGEETRTVLASRVRRERALRRALARNEFCLVYQPVVRLAEAELVAVEALLRWRDPARGLILPSEFVGLAEESGLIWELGLRALTGACRQARRWREAVPGAPPLTISVNLSPRQLEHEGFVRELERLLAETATEPRDLCLEITEGALIGKTGLALRTLVELHRLGVTLAVDDFGTGHASINRLRELPVSVLKIDRTFVSSLGRDRQGVALAAAIVELAHALRVTAIAEGVESIEQLAAVHALGCDGAQGFFLARPRPPEAIERTLRGLAKRRLPFLPEAALAPARAPRVASRRDVAVAMT